ncbi:MAG: polysaccharide biosynthesis tyrosine autokinase [Verrucomicrobia bacterium]|nr:polysaccharide biosynthesis tyrosine autokinase [Verrucomicrobiota bacterium]
MADAPARPPPAHAAERDEDAIERRTLRDYYIILRERLWIALPLALLISVGYGYKKMQVTPMYSATATMQFEKPDTVVLTQSVVDTAIRSDMELNTALQVLSSGKIRTRVLASFTPEEKKILQRAAAKRNPQAAASDNLDLGRMSPYASGKSFLIGINVVHEDPEAAAIVANRYVQTFMDYLFENAGGKNEDAIKYLTEQADRLKNASETAQQRLQQYMKEKNLVSLDSSQNIIADALRKSGSLRDDAALRLLAVDAKVKQMETYQAAGQNLLEIPEISGHGSVAALKGQLNKLQSEQSMLSERYFERHPRMVELTNQIGVTQDELNRALALAIAEWKARQVEARQTLKTYEEEFSKNEKAWMQLGEMSVEYGSIQRQADVAKANYLDILKRLNDTMTVKNVEKIPLHPLDRAGPNYTPFSPNKSDITRTCIGLGVLVFLGVAVGLSFIDDRIKSAWDVESFIGANLLGIIPDLVSMKDEDKYSLLIDNKQAPGVEAFLSVYSSIKIHSKLDFPKSILVTSTIPGEGKTLISCNVAGSFARHGKKTLLIDCDLRRPMLHRHFKQQNNAGLLQWFEDGAAMEGDLATNPALGIIKVGENLSLLCSGGRSKSPTELLEAPVFGQLLERLKREYELVIIDSPPLGAVSDSLLIAERIDEVVYVCRFNRAYRKHIRLYMRALRNGKNEVLGIVLNGLSPRRIEYYSNYRYYRSYKKYYGAQT